MFWDKGCRFFFIRLRMSFMFIFVERSFWRDYRVRRMWEIWWGSGFRELGKFGGDWDSGWGLFDYFWDSM